jgi:hypothetical protein
LCLLAATSAASEGNAADTASKEEASAPHGLNGVRYSRLTVKIELMSPRPKADVITASLNFRF